MPAPAVTAAARPPAAPAYLGCAAHPDCFTCPFADCIAVNAAGHVPARLLKRLRNAEVVRRVRSGTPAAHVAHEMHIPLRTVYRVVATTAGASAAAAAPEGAAHV